MIIWPDCLESMNIENYKTIVFDCDGVLLNSNSIKTEAFFDVTRHYGNEYARALTYYHQQNGGISRYKKFEYFLSTILSKPINQTELDHLAENFATQVKQSLMNCEVANGLEELRARTCQARWLVVSGGDQSELRDIFVKRGLAKLADGGIYGSPDSKDEILMREIANGNIVMPAVFIGDSKYDYRAARRAGLDFLFLSDWSEVEEWNEWVSRESLMSCSSLSELVSKK